MLDYHSHDQHTHKLLSINLTFTFLSKNKQMRNYGLCSGVFTPSILYFTDII